MLNCSRILIVFIFVCTTLFIVEYILSKKHSKLAVILPVIVLCSCIILGFISIFISLSMFAIYWMVNYLDKRKRENASELNKMNIQDLE